MPIGPSSRADTSLARMFVDVPITVSIPPIMAANETGMSSFDRVSMAVTSRSKTQAAKPVTAMKYHSEL